MDRRTMLKTGSLAGIGALTLGTAACEKKDVDFYIAVVTGSMTQLKPFLPNQTVLIDKVISIAKSVNEAYQAGKLDSALLLANNLTAAINEVITAADVNLSDTVKMILSIANVALGTVAVLIEHSRPVPLVNRTMSSAEDNLRSLSSPTRVDAIFQASRP